MKKLLAIILLLPSLTFAQSMRADLVRAFVTNHSTAGASASTPFFMTCVSTSGVQESCAGGGGSTSDSTKVAKTGDTMTGILQMSADILPTADSLYNLGSANKRWSEIYVSSSSLYVGGQVISTSTIIDWNSVAQAYVDGALASTTTILNVSGGTMTGQLTVLSSVTVTDNVSAYGLTASSYAQTPGICLNGNCRTSWPSDFLTAPATFYIVKTSDYLVAPATFTILTGEYLISPATFTIGGAGDNLGNHVATTTLRMGAYGVNTSSNITANAYQIGGVFFAADRAISQSVFIGNNSGSGGPTGVDTTCVGGSSCLSNIGTRNTAIGKGAAQSSDYQTVYGVFVGYQAGLVGGISDNTAIGAGAGSDLARSNFQTFLGRSAGANGSDSQYSTYIGASSGYYGIGGSNDNTCVGASSCYGQVYTAGYPKIGNTAAGYKSFYTATTGSYNTMLGWQSGYTITTGTGNILVGINANTPTAGTSNYLNIGNAIQGQMIVGGTITFKTYIVAAGYSDGTPMPKDKAEAYGAIESIKSDGRGGVDHDTLSTFVKAHYTIPVLVRHERRIERYREPGEDIDREREVDVPVYEEQPRIGRDMSATISALVEVVKDLRQRIETLEK